MNNSSRLLNRFIRPAAARVLVGIVAIWAITAGGAPPEDRYALARKVAKGDIKARQISGSLATEPQPCDSDTITPNRPHWFLPPARPGCETPTAKAPTLAIIHVRPTILAVEYAAETHRDQQYPNLPPKTPLAWESFPVPSELSVPTASSGPDGARARLSSDPTSRQSRVAVLAGRPLLRSEPTPFLRLNIPDPFGVIDAIKLEIDAMPPDNDPAPLPQTPPDPTMPITQRK